MDMLKRFAAILCVMMFCTVALAVEEVKPIQLPARPVEAISRVMVISIDGGRPDLLLRANMPTLRDLMAHGSYSFWAETTDVAITLPSHMSMMTGVVPEKHGVCWNGDEHNDLQPNYPTLLALAHKAGYSTALVPGKSKFKVIANSGGVDYDYAAARGDNEVAKITSDLIKEHKPEVMMVHFAQGDGTGHGIGWGTPEQIAVFENIDKGLAQIVQSLKDAGVYEQTLIILSADHGGSGRGHGGLDPRSRHIPWIASNPALQQNFDLTRIHELVIKTEDTFATSLYVLGIEFPKTVGVPPHEMPSWYNGKPIKQIFVPAEKK